MIRLLEHEAKALLARHGFAIPAGRLFPALPDVPGPFVVKAQVPVGGRGKAGGILFADTGEAAARAAARLMKMSIGRYAVRGVYIEQALRQARELYIAAQVDRDRSCVVLLSAAQGGIEIESVPRERILTTPIDPLRGLADDAVAAVLDHLALPAAARPAFAARLRALHAMLVAEDAELIEINPLMLLPDGSLVAADAKIGLDEDAAFRHSGRTAIPDGTEFERAARELEVIGIELDGDIAALMNGAGMTMATLDQLTALGGRVRALVELHGVMWRGPDHIARVIAHMLTLRPRVLLCNLYFQFRSLETIAAGIALALRSPAVQPMPPVIVRLRGVDEAKAQAMLEGLGCIVTDDFAAACAEAVARAGHPRADAR